MATYAVGDLQGHFEELLELVDQCAFDPGRDQLWLVGDLVNRGPDSLECLRWVRNLGQRAVTVLGNHDLHLLCVGLGAAKQRPGDTLEAVLNAPDAAELLAWLRHRPLLHCAQGAVMIHAGLLPAWSVNQAKSLAREVESELAGPHHLTFLTALYGNQPNAWRDDLVGHDRLRVIVNALTRMRLCTAEGVMEFKHKKGPVNMPDGYLPWFAHPHRKASDHLLIFGHWSALGLKIAPGLAGLDSGCHWGGRLTAYRLEDGAIFSVPCRRMRDDGLD